MQNSAVLVKKEATVVTFLFERPKEHQKIDEVDFSLAKFRPTYFDEMLALLSKLEMGTESFERVTHVISETMEKFLHDVSIRALIHVEPGKNDRLAVIFSFLRCDEYRSVGARELHDAMSPEAYLDESLALLLELKSDSLDSRNLCDVICKLMGQILPVSVLVSSEFS